MIGYELPMTYEPIQTFAEFDASGANYRAITIDVKAASSETTLSLSFFSDYDSVFPIMRPRPRVYSFLWRVDGRRP